MWSFETDPDFQASLDWIDEFTREEIEPLDLVFREPGDPGIRIHPLLPPWPRCVKSSKRNASGHATSNPSWADRVMVRSASG